MKTGADIFPSIFSTYLYRTANSIFVSLQYLKNNNQQQNMSKSTPTTTHKSSSHNTQHKRTNNDGRRLPCPNFHSHI